MKFFLTPASNINSLNGSITSQDVVSAYITQKLENGYLIDIGGTEVFARCLLDFSIGDFLKLKIIEASPSQIVFKVVDHKKETEEPPNLLTTLPPLDIDSQEIQIAFKLLSKLNLPITKERVNFIKEILNHLTHLEKIEPDLSIFKESSLQDFSSSFYENTAPFLKGEFTFPYENQLLELFQNFDPIKEKMDSSLDKILSNISDSKKKAAAVIKEQLALKVINLLHREDSANNTFFFVLPIPVYHKVYLKLSNHLSNKDTPSLRLSFIVNTKNLGTILVDLNYMNGKISASSVFENKEAMNAVKSYLNSNENIPDIIRTMKLMVGKVSTRDFFFGSIKEQPITTGINIKV